MESVDALFLESLSEFVRRIVNFIPNILMMFLVVLLGIVVSAVARFVLSHILSLFQIDGMAERAGIGEMLKRGGIRSSPSRILSSLFYWGILSVFFMMAFIALDIVPLNNLIEDFLYYIPSLIASVVILVIGFVIGNILERATLVAAGNAEISQADLLGKGVKFFIIAMTASMALEQLGIARGIIIAAFSISFGGIVFGLSLAFGLGAQDMAREFLEKRLRKKDKESKGSLPMAEGRGGKKRAKTA